MREVTLRDALRAWLTRVKGVTFSSSDANTDPYLDSCQLCELPREGHGRRYVQVGGYHEFQAPERWVRGSRVAWCGALAAYSRALRRGKTEREALDAFDTVMYGSVTSER